MNNGLTELQAMWELAEAFDHLLLAIALCSTRMLVAFSILPATSDQMIQGTTRAAVVTMLGFFVVFGIDIHHVETMTALQWLGIVFKEALIGLLIGFAASTVFWVAESVGAMIDMQAGYNSVQLMNPLSGQQSTPVSSFLLQFVIMIFYSLGGLLVFVGVLMESFKAWPVMSALPSLKGAADVFFLNEISRMMSLIVKFAAPVLLVLVLIDLGLGLMTKAADKLEPQSLSQPIKGAVTMLLLALLGGVMIVQVRQFLLPGDALNRIMTLIPKG